MRTGARGERFEDFTCSAHLPETAESHRPPVGGAEGIRKFVGERGDDWMRAMVKVTDSFARKTCSTCSVTPFFEA